ncbi:MAG TPA: glycosyltransferase [Dehalococcoidia bacterium]|nr:glycosyltransferase [Dehalococcoidia bacterium]
MRILHVVRGLEPELGGPPRFVVALTSALKLLGVDSTVYGTEAETGTDSAISAPDAEVRLFKRGRFSRYWPGHSPDMRRELGRAVSQFDLVHIHELWHYPNHVAAGAARRNDVPYLISPLGTFAPTALGKGRLKKGVYSALVDRGLSNRAASYHAMTDQEAQDTAANTSNIPIDIVPIGVDPNEFASLPDPGEFERLYPEVRGKRVVLFLGRLNRIKGLDILIKGFARAARSRDDLHLIIAGPDGGYERAARELVRRESLDSSVSFTGPIYGETKLAALSRADVFALTSYGEGFSVALLEALAASVPLIISRECHFPEVAQSGAGVEINLVPQEFAMALTQVVGNPSLLANMRSNARAMATGSYSWDSVGIAFKEVYERISKS